MAAGLPEKERNLYVTHMTHGWWFRFNRNDMGARRFYSTRSSTYHTGVHSKKNLCCNLLCRVEGDKLVRAGVLNGEGENN